MIAIYQKALEETRGARGCVYVATCDVAGVSHSARSRNGAPNGVARALVSAGVEDQPVRVISAGLRGYLLHPSLHKMALRTYSEGASTLVHSARWVDPAAWAARFHVGEGEKQGGTLLPASGVAA